MAFNREKALKAAEKLVAKGKDKDAIAKYEEIVQNDPRDMNSVNKIGDLYLKLGDKAAALDQFAKIAEKYADDGFTLRAIAMYKKCTRTDPARVDFHERLADLNAQQGLINEARSHYETVAEHWMGQGKPEKARDVYAKVAELEPDNLKTRLKLADLYLKDNQINLALGEYQVIGSELAKKGMLEESLQVLNKALGLDPSNTEILRSVAKTHAEMGKAEEGLRFVHEKLQASGGNDPQLLVVMGEVYQAAGQNDQAQAAFERAAQAAPERVEVRTALVRLHLAKGDADAAFAQLAPVADHLAGSGKADEAVEQLKAVLKVKEGHVGALEKLREVHAAAGADEKVLSDVSSRLSEAYIAEGRYQDAEGVLKELVEKEPDVAQHQEKLEFVQVKLQGGGGAAPEAAAVSMEGPSDSDMSFGDLGDDDGGGGFGLSFEEGELDAGATEDDRGEFVREHLAEADVFVKYGLLDKAVEQLRIITEKYPDDLPTRQKLKDLLVEEGKKDEAVRECVAIARLLAESGDSAGEQEALGQAREIDPNHALLTGGEAPAPAAAEAPAGGFEISLDEPAAEAPAPAAEAGGFEISLDEPAAEAPAADAGSAGGFELSLDEPAAAAPAEPEAPAGDAGAAGGFELSFDEPAAEPAAEAAPAGGGEFEISMDEPAAEESGGGEFEISMDEPAAEESGGGEFEISMDEPAAEESGGGEFEISMDEPAAEPAGGGEMEISLDEPAAEPAGGGEMEISLDEPAAEPAPEPAAAAEPEPEPEPEPVAAAPVAAEGEEDGGLFGEEDDFFDFAEELSKELESGDGEETTVSRDGNESMTLDEIIQGMQEGVAQQVDAEDYETHYNLGIAYKEMGLVDEAIGEFQYSSKDPTRFLQCCILLGACFTEKGMPELAIKWYEKAKSAQNISDEDMLALQYEIAECKEAIGEDAEALGVFLEVYSTNARYRDVGEKVQALKAKLGK